MKTKLIIVIWIVLSLCTGSLAIFPCWTNSNTCGDRPACPNPIPDEADPFPCSHTYCDQDIVCSWDASKKRMRTASRTGYIWLEGTEIRQCVGPPTYSNYEDYCCLCSNSGTLYTNPN